MLNPRAHARHPQSSHDRSDGASNLAPVDVTVVILNFNYGEYLEQAIQSVLDQTRSFAQIVVVNDGSTDDSMNVIRRHERVLDVIDIPNGGKMRASQVGLEAVRSEWVYFLDADDYASPDLAFELGACLDRSMVKVQFQLEGVDSEGTPLNSVFPTFPPGYDSQQMQQDNISRGFYVCPPTSGNVYRTAFLRGLDLGALAANDPVDGTPAMIAPYFGCVHCIASPLAFYRSHARNVSQYANPTPAVLAREADRHRRRWLEAAQMVPTLTPPLPGTTFLEREALLMQAALTAGRIPWTMLRAYVRSIRATHTARIHQLAFVAWGIALTSMPYRVRMPLVRLRRAPAARSRWLRWGWRALNGMGLV